MFAIIVDAKNGNIVCTLQIYGENAKNRERLSAKKPKHISGRDKRNESEREGIV